VLGAALASCYRAAPIDEAAVLREIRAESGLPAGDGDAAPGAPVLLTEEAAVAAALANAPRVVSARGEVAVARAGVREARRIENPLLRAGYEPSGLADGALDREEVTVGVRWEPPNPWIVWNAVGEAEARIPLAEAGVEVEQSRAARDVRVAFQRAAHARASAAIVAERVALAERLAGLLRSGADRGAADPLDLAEAESDLAEARGAAVRAAAREQEALAAVASLTGIEGPVAIAAMEASSCRPVPADSGTAEAAVARHPRVREARAAHTRAEAALRLEHARQIPWLRFVEIGWEHRYSAPPSPSRDGVQFSAALELPVLDWNLGAIARARAQRDREAARFRAVLREVVASSGSAAARWRAAGPTVERLAAEAVAPAERAVETARQAARSGRVGEAAVIRAQEKALKVRAVVLDAALECREAEIEARRAAGVP
jgi:outer membrane protein TolC